MDTLGFLPIAKKPLLLIVVGYKAIGISSRVTTDTADQRICHGSHGELAHTCYAESLFNLECIEAVGLGRVLAAALQLTAHFVAIVAVDAPSMYMIMWADLCTV